MKTLVHLTSALALCLLPAITSCKPADEAELTAAQDMLPQEILVTDLAPLVGSEWKLVNLCGEVVPEDADVSLEFHPDDRVTGGASINHYNGILRIVESGVQTEPFAVTRMAGPPEAMEREHAYLAALASAKSISMIGDDQLVIAVDGKELPLRYEIEKHP